VQYQGYRYSKFFAVEAVIATIAWNEVIELLYKVTQKKSNVHACNITHVE